MTEQQQHPSSSNNVPLLDTFPEGQYLFETWLADAVQEYRRASFGGAVSIGRERFLAQLVADKAARWAWDQREPEIQAAADAELEACLRHFEHFEDHWHPQAVINDLRAARRPKPSLKEQALEALEAHFGAMEAGVPTYRPAHKAIIRRAIEAMPDG
jgi:hypothetical protein